MAWLVDTPARQTRVHEEQARVSAEKALSSLTATVPVVPTTEGSASPQKLTALKQTLGRNWRVAGATNIDADVYVAVVEAQHGDPAASTEWTDYHMAPMVYDAEDNLFSPLYGTGLFDVLDNND